MIQNLPELIRKGEFYGDACSIVYGHIKWFVWPIMMHCITWYCFKTMKWSTWPILKFQKIPNLWQRSCLENSTWRVDVGFERYRLCGRVRRIPCGSGCEPGVVEELGAGVCGHIWLEVGEVARPAVDLLQQMGSLQGGSSWDETKAASWACNLLLPGQVLRHRILQVPNGVWVLVRWQGGGVSMVGWGWGGGRGCWLTGGLWVSALRSVGFSSGRA